MKTVMKKMFCLMLVAVLMVGVMPFQASALTAEDGYVTVPVTVIINNTDTYEKSIQIPEGESVDLTWEYAKSTVVTKNHDIRKLDRWTNANGDDVTGRNLSAIWLTDPANGVDTYSLTLYVTENSVPEHTHTWSDATCTAPQTCECGATNGSVNKNNHTNVVIDAEVPATCSTAGKTEGSHCSACGTVIKPQSDIPATGHTEIATPDVAATCTTAGQTGGKHCSVCNTVTVTPVAVPALGHTPGAAATCTTPQICTVCNEQITAALGHNVVDGKCTRCYVAPQTTGAYSLKVWAKLWIGESLHKTILLDTITGLNGTEVVPYVIGDNVARLESKFPAGYKNIEWTKAVYYMIDSTKSGTVDTNMNVNEEDNVYINLYSQEKLVVVRVHTAKTYGVDRSVQVGGFRPGDVVSYDDVLKAVSKHYNVSSMKMYTYDEWEKVVAGSNGSTIPNFVVQGGDNDNVYEVYVTGTYKTTGTSTTYKADSSNPKTGDMIFAPAMVLGLSASALAVLYYLNKKRAF